MHILFHRSTPWQSDIHCSTKTYSKLFRDAGHEVSYLEDMPHFGHLIARKGYYHVWKNSPRFENSVWIFNTITAMPYLLKPFLCNIACANASYYCCFPSIKSALYRSGRKDPDVIWTTKPGSVALKKIFPKSLLIYHVIDYYPAFHGERIKNMEKNDYHQADHVFVIGHSLKKYLIEELKVNRDKLSVLDQGVSINKYNKHYDIPDDIADLPKPRALWVGELKKCDTVLFKAVAEILNERGGSLILIGHEANWVKQICSTNNNVFYLGSKNINSVPAYLNNVDIGLMLYDLNKSKVYIGQNPLKLYEYAAAGLPIISTPHDEFDYLKPPVIKVRSKNDIPLAISEAIDNKHHYQKLAIQFAKRHSWKSSFDKALSIITELRSRISCSQSK